MRFARLALFGGAVLLTAGLIALYGRTAVLDERGFADRATSAFTSDEVQDEVSQRLADREIEAAPELAAQRPALEAAIGAIVRNWQCPRTFRAATVNLHRGLFDGEAPDLTLPGAGAELHAALPPKSAALLPAGDPELLHLGGGRLESGLVDAAPSVRRLAAFAPLALLAGFALLAFAGLRAPT